MPHVHQLDTGASPYQQEELMLKGGDPSGRQELRRKAQSSLEAAPAKHLEAPRDPQDCQRRFTVCVLHAGTPHLGSISRGAVASVCFHLLARERRDQISGDGALATKLLGPQPRYNPKQGNHEIL
ncbi:hypothetical protein NDU88_009684 [Pleurodeles waltl]|uniref:Uncharacterized protein n=1 Tax=Pleurodeles waltl TaxID=8319 RepID=A0AAV7QY86_PLEWA|nr:hypothetical protein NDU88_009684 [Pleurodeles waltl]